MSFAHNINTLIADKDGIATKDFLTTTETQWAKTQMDLRYNTAPPNENDAEGSYAQRCYSALVAEYRALRSWFVEPEFKLSILLQSRFLSNKFSGTIGDGFGWDFRADGDPEPRVLYFKSTLMTCERQVRMLPPGCAKPNSAGFGGIAKLVRHAFQLRAEAHLWAPRETKKAEDPSASLSGEDIAKRWIAYRATAFLISLGMEPGWAWNAGGCARVFGCADESGVAPVTKVDAD
jgi:hypothetical protein